VPALLAYIGPETILPATSVLAGLGGLLLMFGHRLRGMFNRCVQRITGRKPAEAEVSDTTEGEVAEADVAEGETAEALEEVEI
jgi:hypothetical protein